jgi:hypothetical protein
MRPSRRRLTEQGTDLAARNERLRTERDDARRNAHACASQLERVAAELSTAKDVIASHIVAAGHPSTVLQSPQEFAGSLCQSLADAGVDLRIELARLEGVEL